MNKRSKRVINTIYLVAGCLFILYYLIMGIYVRFGQSLLWMWLVFGIACVGRYFICRFKRPTVPKRLKYILRSIAAVALAIFISVECMIIGGAVTTVPEGLDCIIILGARVDGSEPSGALRNRIDVALDYLKDNPETIAIASGGQGEDEEISEAQCIYNELVESGIDKDRIIIEDNSTDTLGNLKNTLAIIGNAYSTIGIVTSDFHVYRSVLLARNVFKDPDLICGIPARSTALSFPHYAMREFCCIVVEALSGNLSISQIK